METKEKRKEKSDLRIKFLPYEKFRGENFDDIIKDLKENTIILIDAKLSAEQEAYIIKETMKSVSDKFSGIELGSLSLDNYAHLSQFNRLKNALVETLIGKKRGMTLIGPAKIVHKIQKNPHDLLLYL